LTPAPPKPVLPVPKKLRLMLGRELMIFTKLLLSARKFLMHYICLFSILFEIAFLSCRFICCSGDEEEDAPTDVAARTSTSRTVVVSETHPDGDETSPPQQNIEHSMPAVSPQAPSPKRARVEPAKEPTMLVGCSSTPLMEEVSYFLFSCIDFTALNFPLFISS
jgi:hypothetical protein